MHGYLGIRKVIIINYNNQFYYGYSCPTDIEESGGLDYLIDLNVNPVF